MVRRTLTSSSGPAGSRTVTSVTRQVQRRRRWCRCPGRRRPGGRSRAASGRRTRRPRRPARPARTPRPGSARPRGRRAGGRSSNSSSSASCGSRVRRWTVARGVVEDPAVRGRGRAAPSRRAAAGASSGSVVGVADGEQRVVDRRRCWCRPASCRTAPAAGGCRRRAAREETQRLVPSAAALRPSSVVANFQVTNGRPWSIAKVHSRLTRAGLVLEQPALDLDAGRAQGGRSPGGDGVRVALGEDHAAYAGLDQRPGARAGAAGVVAGLEGDHGGRAAGGRRRPGAARRPRRAACRRPRWQPSATVRAGVVEQHAADPRVGAGRDAGRTRPARARAASPRCSSSGWCSRSSPPVGSTDPGACGRSLAPRHWLTECSTRPSLVRLPIRTLTVGPGVPPGQPAAGCSRVADFHRRLGFSPTPEHVSCRSYVSSVAQGTRPLHRGVRHTDVARCRPCVPRSAPRRRVSWRWPCWACSAQRRPAPTLECFAEVPGMTARGVPATFHYEGGSASTAKRGPGRLGYQPRDVAFPHHADGLAAAARRATGSPCRAPSCAR